MGADLVRVAVFRVAVLGAAAALIAGAFIACDFAGRNVDSGGLALVGLYGAAECCGALRKMSRWCART